MNTTRIPLADNPDAANSPRRVALASKRGRAQLAENEDYISPPKKKQHLETTAASFRRAQKISLHEPEGRVFAQRRANAPQSQFQRKLLATQEGRQVSQVRVQARHVEQPVQSKEQIQNWRRHYRRVFPSYVFYFEGLAPEAAYKSKRLLLHLGARHEQFFSKDVTHVVTNRPIPPPELSSKPPKTTVNPSVLSKANERPASRTQQRGGLLSQELGARGALDARQAPQTNDVLYKARELRIKIWNLEKLDRIVGAMFTADSEDEDEAGAPARSHAAGPSKVAPLKREREGDDLSQLLKNEKNNAAVQRKPWQEIVPFKGLYIYVHDMDEQHKPVMLREYPNPIKKEEGEWPMLRSVGRGRCPFVEDPPPQERRPEQSKQRKPQEQPSKEPPRLTRAHTAPTPAEAARQTSRTRSQTRSPEKNALRDIGQAQNQIIKPAIPTSLSKPFEVPTMNRQTTGSTEFMPPLLGSAQAGFKGISRNPGAEPMASGLQGLNATSAIRSQMYSSTAPSAPGSRVGMSKQQHQMSRKVLERQSGLSCNSVPSSFNNDIRAAINNERSSNPRRSTRQKTAEPLDQIYEDDECVEDEAKAHKQQKVQLARQKKKAAKRDPKPGYCENCRDKYDDFYEHVACKKHKKFAASDENWKDLDDLLKKLTRV